jgi:hypothetical protein
MPGPGFLDTGGKTAGGVRGKPRERVRPPVYERTADLNHNHFRNHLSETGWDCLRRRVTLGARLHSVCASFPRGGIVLGS